MTNRKQQPSSPPTIPSAPEVERTVLGAVLRDNDALYEVIDRLTPESFHNPQYRHVYEAIVHVSAAGQPVDIQTVAVELEKRDLLEVCGGRAKVIDIADSVYTSANIRTHTDILLEFQKRRALWQLSFDIQRDLHESPDEVTAHAEVRMLEIADIGRRPMDSTDAQIERMIRNDTEVMSGERIGFEWPIPELTRITHGIRPGRIYLIIGLYKTGKSKLAIAAIECLIAKQQVPILFLSLEMGPTQVFHWLAGCALKINTELYESEGLGKEQMKRTHDWVMKNVGSGRLIVDDRAFQTPESICTAMRRAAIKDGVKVVFIDYLQRIAWARHKVSVTDIASGMNMITSTAKRLGLSVVALSQVPKSVEHQPAEQLINLGDVKDAAAFAEVADVSVAITDPHRKKLISSPEKTLKFLVEQRDGPKRVLDIRADLRYGCFESVFGFNPQTENSKTAGLSMSITQGGKDRATA